MKTTGDAAAASNRVLPKFTVSQTLCLLLNLASGTLGLYSPRGPCREGVLPSDSKLLSSGDGSTDWTLRLHPCAVTVLVLARISISCTSAHLHVASIDLIAFSRTPRIHSEREQEIGGKKAEG